MGIPFDIIDNVQDIPYLGKFVEEMIIYIALIPDNPEYILGDFIRKYNNEYNMMYIEFDNVNFCFYGDMDDIDTWVHELTEFSIMLLTEKETMLLALTNIISHILYKNNMTLDELLSIEESHMKKIVNKTFSSKYSIYYKGKQYENTLRHTIASLITETYMGDCDTILTNDEFWEVLTNQKNHKYTGCGKCRFSDEIYYKEPIYHIQYKCEHSYKMKKELFT